MARLYGHRVSKRIVNGDFTDGAGGFHREGVVRGVGVDVALQNAAFFYVNVIKAIIVQVQIIPWS